MPKQINYGLSTAELAQIEAAIDHDERPEVRLRALAIRMLHLGQRPQASADLLHVSTASIYNWHRAWREVGIAGLANAPKSGRPVVATAEYIAQVEQVLEQDPAPLGYDFTIWTVERILHHLAQTSDVRLSAESLRQLRVRRGYVFRRPAHDLRPLQDVDARQRAETLLADLKKKRPTTNLNYSLWTKQP